jgi:1-acyl-sn-glycerol-3-phosphate acyltransferase
MLKYLRLGIVGGIPLVFATPWMLRYAKKPHKKSISVRYAHVQKFIAFICRDMKCRFIVTGLENVPTDTNVLYVSNHQSNVDPLSMVALSPRPLTFLTKKEAEKFPWVGTIIKDIDGIFMNRKNFRDEVRAISKTADILKNVPEESFVIYPEGTRSREIGHPMASFKAGALKPAYEANKPIVPVAIYGSFRCLDKKLVMRRYPVQVSYLKPIWPEEYQSIPTVDLAAMIEKEVRAELEILRQRDKVYVEEDRLKRCKVSPDVRGL